MTSLSEAYANPSIREPAEHWMDIWRNPIDSTLDAVGSLAHLSSPAALVPALDSLPLGPVQQGAARLMSCLPARFLLDTYGEEVTAWTIGNDGNERRVDMLAEDLNNDGYDDVLLKQSRCLSRENIRNITGREVLAQNAVMEAVLGTTLDKLDAAELVAPHSTTGEALSAKRCRDYGLIALRADATSFHASGWVINWEGKDEAQKSGTFYPMYLDTPVGIGLTYKGKPQAIIGIAAGGPEPDELTIRQLQRVPGKVPRPDKDREAFEYRQPRGLMPLDWQKVMVDTASQFAGLLGMDKVAIRGSANVYGRYNCYITQDQAVRAYDEVAQRLGFTGSAAGDWHEPTPATR